MDGQHAYTITNVRPDSVWTDGGTPVQGYRVEFTTAKGVQSFVHVPRSPNFEQDVHAAVSQEADTLDRVITGQRAAPLPLTLRR